MDYFFELDKEIVLKTTQRKVSPCTCCNFVVEDQNGTEYFCKCLTEYSSLQAEFQGLEEIQKTNTIHVPKPICIIAYKNYFYGLFEFLHCSKERLSQYELGRYVAKMHKSLSDNGLYGYYNDNFIGITPQDNTWEKSWCDFFVNHRLKPQFDYLVKNQLKLSNIDIDVFLNIVRELLKNHEPPPSLCHGDLWSGNADMLEDGTPTIYDPAVYYGDRETDIAMTKLFNGFTDDFYDGYNSEWKLDDDYQVREDIYILYHVLNHANMFGSIYLADAISLIKKIMNSKKN